jgi:hypothetical protein
MGTVSGGVEIWDINVNRWIKMMQGRLGRMRAMAWNGDLLSSASHDGVIVQHDMTMPNHVVRRLIGHEGKVSRK